MRWVQNLYIKLIPKTNTFDEVRRVYIFELVLVQSHARDTKDTD